VRAVWLFAACLLSWVLWGIALTCIAQHAFAQSAPVPGVVNPAVTQANIGSTICVHNWTKTIRPPASYTNKLKAKQMGALGLTGDPHAFEEDHLISLEIGGNPTDPENLWPQPWHGSANAHHKDRLENLLHKLVCSGRESLIDAQHEIATDWIASYEKHFGTAP
jgi:hypothetical protein